MSDEQTNRSFQEPGRFMMGQEPGRFMMGQELRELRTGESRNTNRFEKTPVSDSERSEYNYLKARGDDLSDDQKTRRDELENRIAANGPDRVAPVEDRGRYANLAEEIDAMRESGMVHSANLMARVSEFMEKFNPVIAG
jgi:hypothetical protein